jgi:hypothetical protein
MLAVYASPPPSPAVDARLATGLRAADFPNRTFTGKSTSALHGAPPTALIGVSFASTTAQCPNDSADGRTLDPVIPSTLAHRLFAENNRRTVSKIRYYDKLKCFASVSVPSAQLESGARPRRHATVNWRLDNRFGFHEAAKPVQSVSSRTLYPARSARSNSPPPTGENRRPEMDRSWLRIVRSA